MKQYALAIVGGGASGMMAAVAAGSDCDSVLLLERGGRIGRKLLATGNGRCNISNRNAQYKGYHGGAPDFVRPALHQFPVDQTLRLFEEMGLPVVEQEDGKLYLIVNQGSMKSFYNQEGIYPRAVFVSEDQGESWELAEEIE